MPGLEPEGPQAAPPQFKMEIDPDDICPRVLPDRSESEARRLRREQEDRERREREQLLEREQRRLQKILKESRRTVDGILERLPSQSAPAERIDLAVEDDWDEAVRAAAREEILADETRIERRISKLRKLALSGAAILRAAQDLRAVREPNDHQVVTLEALNCLYRERRFAAVNLQEEDRLRRYWAGHY